MNVFLYAQDVLAHYVHFAQLDAFALALRLAHAGDVLQVVGLVEVGNVSGVQDVVHVFEHLLVDYLGVDQEEDDSLVFHAGEL